MFTFYPSLKANMGKWEYYVTRMTMSSVIREVKFASEFGAQENQVDLLEEARQREIAEKRVRGPIMEFLQQDYRFFSSIVVAVIGEKPRFYPVSVAEDTVGNAIADAEVNDTFGLLRMGGNVQMYALDGQHRLSAIKCMLDESYRRKLRITEHIEVPPGFAEEHISVVMIIRKASDTPQEFLRGYRRLFSNLNRYAQKTDQKTNIIMDEDDAYAILTRRLISQHSFFKGSNKKQAESTRVKMKKGKNLNAGDPQFIPLAVLYDTTEILLKKKDEELNKRIRLDEGALDQLYKELTNYWDAILAVFPQFYNDPLKMREQAGKGHMFFRPIGQKMLAELVRNMLDDSKFPEKKAQDSDMKKRLSVLAKIDWNVDHHPWDGVVTVPDGEGGYIMRNEKRDKAMKVARLMALRMTGDTEFPLDGLLDEWKSVVNLGAEEAQKKWKEDVIPLFSKKK